MFGWDGTTDILQRSQISYTTTCNGFVSHRAQFRGLRVFADHTCKNKCCMRSWSSCAMWHFITCRQRTRLTNHSYILITGKTWRPQIQPLAGIRWPKFWDLWCTSVDGTDMALPPLFHFWKNQIPWSSEGELHPKQMWKAHSKESETVFDFREKLASLLDHINRILSHKFVTWHLRNISRTKIVKFFWPCMSEHMIYIRNLTNVTERYTKMSQMWTNKILHHDDKISYKAYEIVFNMFSIIRVLHNTEFYNASEPFKSEIFLFFCHKRDPGMGGNMLVS